MQMKGRQSIMHYLSGMKELIFSGPKGQSITVPLPDTQFNLIRGVLMDHLELDHVGPAELIYRAFAATYLPDQFTPGVMASVTYTDGVSYALGKVFGHIYDIGRRKETKVSGKLADTGHPFIDFAEDFFLKNKISMDEVDDVDINSEGGIIRGIEYRIDRLNPYEPDVAGVEPQAIYVCRENLSDLMMRIEEKPADVMLAEIFTLVKKQWHVCGRTTGIYDLLERSAKAARITGTASERRELIDLISSSDLWR